MFLMSGFYHPNRDSHHCYSEFLFVQWVLQEDDGRGVSESWRDEVGVCTEKDRQQDFISNVMTEYLAFCFISKI